MEKESVDILEFGRGILHDEARALDALAESLGDDFTRAVDLILGATGKLIVGGLGKSGHENRANHQARSADSDLGA